MADFLSNSIPSLGSLNIEPFIRMPALPNIVVEWAAIIPLVCHLASYRQDYKTTAGIALLKEVRLELLPRLGRLEGLSRLLNGGTKFVDQASMRGGASKTVWDVRWGSVFPCANGAASDMVIDLFMSKKCEVEVEMPDNRPLTAAHGVAPAARGTAKSSSLTPPSISATDSSLHRRYQALHILDLSFTQDRTRICSPAHSRAYRAIPTCALVLLLLGLALVSGLCGAYGTSTLLICATISSIAKYSIVIDRPLGYLESNESTSDTCMLLAPHGNAQDWLLLVGERGIVDTLLNKPMIAIPKSRANHCVALWFRAAHIIQLLAMTFVAAQKGWDGVLLLGLMVVDSMLSFFNSSAASAARWAEVSNVTANGRTFLFGSRMVMIGTIEVLWGTGRTIWMNDILVPHPRRDAWLDAILSQRQMSPCADLSDFDQRWVDRSSMLVHACAKKIQECMPHQQPQRKGETV